MIDRTVPGTPGLTMARAAPTFADEVYVPTKQWVLK
jgi:hypothetical protein